MKNFYLTIGLLFISTIPALAQSGSSYRIDNFDLKNAVRVQTPPVQAPAPASKSARGRRLTTKSNNYSSSPTSLKAPVTINLSSSLSGYTTGDAKIDQFIIDSGHRNLVDPLLLYSIMHQESTFKPRAMSNKGARGLMQLMPGTAARFGVSSIWDPRQNIEGGARYMRF